MKSIFKLGLAAVLVASVIVTSFAFTSQKSSSSTETFALPRYFKYTGPASFTQSDLLNINNWSEVSNFISVDHTPTIVAEIQIDQNEGTYIYTSGPKTGKLQLDVVGNALRNDVIVAGGFAPSPNNFIQEVTTPTAYDILVNSTKL